MDTRLITKKLISAVICMIMAVAMILPSAQLEAFAAGDTGEGSMTSEAAEETLEVPDAEALPEEVPQEEVPELTTNVYYSTLKYDIVFKQDVVAGEFLGSKMQTNTLVAKGNKKSIKLTWSSVKNPDGITGYFIAKKNNTDGRYYQLTSVARDVFTYTDKKAKKENIMYKYILIPYSDADGYIRIGKPSKWASAVTTKSDKKNVDKIQLDRAAASTAVSVGRTTKVEGRFNEKAVEKTLRWTTSNKKIATVSKKGVIRGKGVGTATISARTHTGYVLKFNILVVKPGTASAMIDVMNSWMGYSYYNKKNRGIVDIYNSMPGAAYSYKMQYYDAWCDCTVSAAGFVSGCEDLIGRECSVPRHIKIFKSKGIWKEGCKRTPKPGDLVVFNWSPKNKKNASHIGIVASVDGKTVTTIEGNMGIGVVGSRTYKVGWKYIRGYARPKYAAEIPAAETSN